MYPAASPSAVEWHLSLGSSTMGILADSLLFFVAAILLLSYLGLGVAAGLLPKELRKAGWIFAPYYGYSTFVLISALLVAFGATVAMSLAFTLVLASAANGWAWRTGRLNRARLGSARAWWIVVAIALPSYSIAAITMAHNGSTAFLGDQIDIYVLVPLTEWLKFHSAPLFTPGSTSWLVPYWDASLAPLSGWTMEGSHLGYAGHRWDDALFLFQWAPRYFDAGLGLILGWDSFQTIRPTMAVMLALSGPAVFLFCRNLLKASPLASVLAAALAVMNGSQMFWIMRANSGQAAWTFLVPVILTVVLLAVDDHRLLPSFGAGLLIAAFLISYYQGVPLLGCLIAAGLVVVTLKRHSLRGIWVRVAAMGVTVVVVAMPDHIKMILIWLNGRLAPSSWKYVLAPVSDALGTTIVSGPYSMIAGQGQLGTVGEALVQAVCTVATIIGLLILFRLVVLRWRDPALLMLWALLIGSIPIFIYSRFFAPGTPGYIYSKTQAMITFLVAAGLALGIEGWLRELWKPGQPVMSRPNPVQFISAVGLSLFLLAVAGNLALSTYAFWKPVGNKWDPNAWETKALGMALPAGAEVHLSTGIMAGPEATIEMIYALRNQRVKTSFPLQTILGDALSKPIADAMDLKHSSGVAGFDLLGIAEIAASKGYVPSDRMWSNYLVSAYRMPPQSPVATSTIPSSTGTPSSLPTRLPAIVQVRGDGAEAATGGSDERASSGNPRLIMTLASERSTKVAVATTTGRQELTLQPGVSVRSIAVQDIDRVELTPDSGSPVHLLATEIREMDNRAPLEEDCSKVLAIYGNSSAEGDSVTTRLTYLGIGVPVALSLDVYLRKNDSHEGWLELPLYPDNRIKELEARLDGGLASHEILLDGEVDSSPYSTSPLPDGEYTAYLTMSSESRIAKRIPLYSYRLIGGHATDFESWPVRIAWDGSKIPAGQ